MSYINKKQYEYRAYSAEKKNFENVQIAIKNGMSDECAELLASLCQTRHNVHTNIDVLVRNHADTSIYQDIVNIIEKINVSELPYINIDVTEIDDMYLLDYCGDLADENGDRDIDKYNSEYERIYSEWEKLNKKIEEYLSKIDSKYNTNYCPTGALRVF